MSIRTSTLLSGVLLAACISVTTASAQNAALTGRTYVESSMQALPQVEILILELNRTTMSDEKGAFTLKDIPPGTYVVRARRIGYALYESVIEFKKDKTIERGVVLPALTQLDTLRVVGDIYVPLSFLEHRVAGRGHFFTREDIAKQEGIGLVNILSTTPDLGIARGRSSQGWILSKRVVPRLSAIGRSRNDVGGDFYTPDSSEIQRGMIKGCYARVYLDNVLMNPSSPADPVDLNQFNPKSIEAIEYYSGPAQTPAKYSRLNSTCGVLVIHRRKSP